MANRSITAVQGFLASGVSCDIKASGKLDMGMIVCPEGATASAVFTTNQVFAAPVHISRQHVKNRLIKGVVVNSGNANACTGKRGLAHANTMCQEAARRIQAEPHQVLVASTGIIGEPLPMSKVRAGIHAAADQLGHTGACGHRFARAIMTTDTKPKQTIRSLDISNCRVNLAGTVKGAGMIGPNMATTLCFITTDLPIDKPLLQRSLQTAIGESLNRLTVDGHQSTNDTAVLLSSGKVDCRPVTRPCPRFARFQSALVDLCDDLAQQMALDAEGATRMFKVVVTGAASRAEAARAARAIADYPLVKCAVHGGDPNWGRIVCAAGSIQVKMNPNKLSCKLDDLTVFRDGTPCAFDRTRASRIVTQAQHMIAVDLGVGRGTDWCYGVDLSRSYVRINADYHT